MTGSYFGRGDALVDIYYIRCYGYENSISDCPSFSSYIISRSSTSLDWRATRPVAGVVCDGYTALVTECEEGEVRLMGGEREGEGRVEVCEEGFWSTVCGDLFDQKAATVICRQLGYLTPLSSEYRIVAT